MLMAQPPCSPRDFIRFALQSLLPGAAPGSRLCARADDTNMTNRGKMNLCAVEELGTVMVRRYNGKSCEPGREANLRQTAA